MHAESNNEKLGYRTAYTYALGDFCFTFFIMFIGYYLMYYLTDVVRFPTATAAAIYTLVQIFETMGILVGGVVIDRVRLRGGRYRPWLLIGGIWCGISLVILFTKYDIPLGVYRILFPALYLITYWGYNFMWVSFRSLAGKISRNREDVMRLSVASQHGAVAASLVYSLIGATLLYGFSKITTGYTVSSAIYGAVIILCMTMVYWRFKPYDHDQEEACGRVALQSVKLKDYLKCFSGPMLPYFLSCVLRNSVSVAIPALMVYYFHYVLHSENGVALYLSTTSVVQVLAALLLKPIARKFSKTSIFRFTALFSALCTVCAYFFGGSEMRFILFMALNNFCLVIGGGINNAFITDIADYNEYVQGLNTRSFSVSISGTSNTLASLIGGGIASFSLAFIGYDADVVAVSESVTQGIRVLVTLGPAVLTVLSLVPFLFYKLDDRKMSEIYMRKRAQEQEI